MSSTIEVLEALSFYACNYRKIANASIKRNSHMNNATGNDIDQRDIDALLTDYINFIATMKGVDYAMYTKDIENEI